MSFAINVRAENSTAEPVCRLWDQVEQFEETSSIKPLGYPPHFTFGIYDEIAPELLAEAAIVLTKDRQALHVTFSKIEFFDVDPLVLWLRAEDESPLFEMHELVHQMVPDQTCHTHYKRGQWQPHCTLGFQVKQDCRAAALEFAKKPLAPFTVVFNMIDWVSYPPVEILGEFNLPHGDVP